MIRLIESNPERERIWTTSLKCAILWLGQVTDYTCICITLIQDIMDIVLWTLTQLILWKENRIE